MELHPPAPTRKLGRDTMVTRVTTGLNPHSKAVAPSPGIGDHPEALAGHHDAWHRRQGLLVVRLQGDSIYMTLCACQQVNADSCFLDCGGQRFGIIRMRKQSGAALYTYYLIQETFFCHGERGPEISGSCGFDWGL